MQIRPMPTESNQDIAHSNHGGKRDGAGRKPTGKPKKVPKSVSLSQDLAEFLDNQPNKSSFVEALLRQAKTKSLLSSSEQDTVTLTFSLTRHEAKALTLLQTVQNNLKLETATTLVSAISKLLKALAAKGIS